jgi:hypothetical protein
VAIGGLPFSVLISGTGAYSRGPRARQALAAASVLTFTGS